MAYSITAGGRVYRFADLRTLMAKASPRRSGDELAGIAAATMEERVAVELDHLHCHAGHPMNDKVQIECSPAYWREFCMAYGIYAPSRPVSFDSRRGDLQRVPVLGIPVVVVPDGGEAVLRPRWPETVRLVQGG